MREEAMRASTSLLKEKSAVFLLAIATACGSELPTYPDWEGVGVLGEYIIHDGIKRAYALNVPSSYDNTEFTPLLIMFHGAGDDGPNFQRWSRLDSVAGPAGIITAYPNGSGYGCPDDVPVEDCDDTPPFLWNSQDVAFTRELIAHLRHELTIDSTRIFAAGFSNGSLFTHRLGCELAGKLAAVAPVSGPLTPQIAISCFPTRPISVLLVHGTEDMSFPWDGSGPYMSAPSTASTWSEVNACVGEPTVEWLPDTESDGTRVWTETYDDCDGEAEVLFYGIEGGGHTWPGHVGFPPSFGLTSHDISVNEEIVRFLSRHALR